MRSHQLTGLPCPSCARYTLMSPLPLIRSLALSKPGVHVIACSTAGKSMDDGDTDGVKRSKQRSGRNAERKAKQAELIELRGPHSNVTPQTWSERLRQMEASAARESGVGGSTPLKGAAAVVRSLQTVAAKAAARSAVRASPGRQNLPISTIAPGQVRAIGCIPTQGGQMVTHHLRNHAAPPYRMHSHCMHRLRMRMKISLSGTCTNLSSRKHGQ